MTRTATRQSGSAYGYEPRSYRSRMFTGRSQAGGVGRVFSLGGASTRFAPDYEELGRENMNFAERLLLANEGTAFGISDLWVAAATQADDQYSQIEYLSDNEEGEEDRQSQYGIDDEGEEPDFFGYGSAPPSLEDLRGTAQLHAARSPSRADDSGLLPRTTTMDSRASMSARRVPSGRERIFSTAASTRPRRDSLASSMRAPALYSNTGLASQPVLLSPGIKTPQNENQNFGSLAAIPESGSSSRVFSGSTANVKPEGSLIWLLPVALIAQQSLVALHGTAMDQIFMFV